MGVPGKLIFSHGRKTGESFAAAISALHFTDPETRAYGAASNDRVHKSFFYGSKHIDQYVPKTNPNPRMELTMAKEAAWAADRVQGGGATPSYMTTYKGEYTAAAAGR